MTDGIELSPGVIKRLQADPAWESFVEWTHELDPARTKELQDFADTFAHEDAGPIWYQLREAMQDHPPNEEVGPLAARVLEMLAPELHPQMPKDYHDGDSGDETEPEPMESPPEDGV